MATRGSKAKPSRKRRAVAKKSATPRRTKKPTRKPLTVAGTAVTIGVLNSLWDLTAHAHDAAVFVLKVLEKIPHLAHLHYQNRLDHARTASGRLDQTKAAKILAQAVLFNHILELAATQLQERIEDLEKYPNAPEALARRLIDLICETSIELAPSAIRAGIDDWYFHESLPTSLLKKIPPRPRRRV